MTAEQVQRAAGLRAPQDHGGDLALLGSVLDRHGLSEDGPGQVQPMVGGLTNRIYQVTLPSQRKVVARVLSGASSLLEIDRHAECENSRKAAQAGVGPGVLAFDPQVGVAVIEWLDGHALTSADVDDSTVLSRIAAACRVLHAGPRFVNDFDMFALQRDYLAIVLANGIRLPVGYLDLLPGVERIHAALSVRHEETVPCHNDLLAANIIDDGERIWFIDYEYSGNNDPCFELGNIWSESDLGIDRLEELVTAYYGQPSRAKTARARLLALMSKYGWTLWACIQAAGSEVDFDFWSWGMEKYERAVAEFEGPDMARLIEDAQLVDLPRGSAQ